MYKVCDFCCSDAEPTTLYVLDRGDSVVTSTYSDGSLIQDSSEWLACDECAALVDAADVAGLIQRSRLKNPSWPAIVQRHGSASAAAGALAATLRFVFFNFPIATKRPWAQK